MELAAEKLSAEAEKMRNAEGWKWAAGELETAKVTKWSGPRIYPERIELEAADAEREAKLQARLAEIETILGEVDGEDGTVGADISQEADEIQTELSQLAEKGAAYPAAKKALAGVIVAVNHDGSLSVHRGLVRPEDAKALANLTETAERDDASEQIVASAVEARAVLIGPQRRVRLQC